MISDLLFVDQLLKLWWWKKGFWNRQSDNGYAATIISSEDVSICNSSRFPVSRKNWVWVMCVLSDDHVQDFFFFFIEIGNFALLLQIDHFMWINILDIPRSRPVLKEFQVFLSKTHLGGWPIVISLRKLHIPDWNFPISMICSVTYISCYNLSLSQLLQK